MAPFHAATTVTALSSLGNPSTVGQAITFTAQVSPRLGAVGTPTGSVDFKDLTQGQDLGSATLVNGVASLAVSALSAGTHNISAIYSGDTNFASSSDTSLTQTVSGLIVTGADAGGGPNVAAFDDTTNAPLLRRAERVVVRRRHRCGVGPANRVLDRLGVVLPNGRHNRGPGQSDLSGQPDEAAYAAYNDF